MTAEFVPAVDYEGMGAWLDHNGVPTFHVPLDFEGRPGWRRLGYMQPVETPPHSIFTPAGDRNHLYAGACQCTCDACEAADGGCICPDCNGECLGHAHTQREVTP